MAGSDDEGFAATQMNTGQPTLLPGVVLAGRFEIESALGHGGMGAVYKAHDRAVGDVVALKTLMAAGGLRPEALERFRREVRLARRITHRNVARIHDLGEHDGVPFLTMEYVEGEDLDGLLRRYGRVEPARVVRIGLEIAEGLSAAHDAGVVHRDLKPANVLIHRQGRVVLTDFGIARTIEWEATQLQTAGLLGTPAYMAPEQVEGGEVDARTDLYALGIVLFELLVGEPPFAESTIMATAIARLHRDPPDVRERVSVPESLAQIVAHCLQRDRDCRPNNAAEVAERLRNQLEHSPDSGALLSVPPRATSPPTDTVSPGDRALAVLPFRYRGPADHDYLGDALGDELIDLLSRTRGLRVLASGAVQRYRDERDPRTVGRELGVDAIVDGTVQGAGHRLRVSARLVDVASGTQMWSERIDTEIEDVLEVQDRLGRRIAEALRVELATAPHRAQAPREAIEAYLMARHKSRELQLDGPNGAVALLERCIQLAPGFGPALGAHAIVGVRGWFVPGIDPERDWQQLAEQSVERALAEAGDMAESHFAAGMLAVQKGEYAQAVRALQRTLDIAPTYADAHGYLGRLQCEAGRLQQGERRLRMVRDLDPTHAESLFDLARTRALQGDREGAEDTLRRLREIVSPTYAPLVATDARIAGWWGDYERARRVLSTLPEDRSTAISHLFAAFGQLLEGSLTAEEVRESFAQQRVRAQGNLRFRALGEQVLTELACQMRAYDLGLELFGQLTGGALIDLAWVDLCPVLEPLRERPEYAEGRRRVVARVEALWQV